jgi:hypothetical protein
VRAAEAGKLPLALSSSPVERALPAQAIARAPRDLCPAPRRSGADARLGKSNLDRTTAGRSGGSSCSGAAVTAAENRPGLCITMSIMRTRPLSQLTGLPAEVGGGLADVVDGARPRRCGGLRTWSAVASLKSAWRLSQGSG